MGFNSAFKGLTIMLHVKGKDTNDHTNG